MEAKFPLQTAPQCLRCARPCTRKITSASNRNGNAGRPYYSCAHASHSFKFACWDDGRGLSPANPECECGYASRQFTSLGEDFFGCPVGACGWVSLACCEFLSEPAADDDDRRDPPVEIRIDDNLKWEVTSTRSMREEVPLCSICRLALEKLRGPDDAVTTSIPAELRSDAGCRLCAFFVRYAEKHPDAAEGPNPPHYLRYEFDEVDLGQATLYLLRYELGKPFVSHKWHTQSALGCLPSTSTETASEGLSLGGSFAQSMELGKMWIQQCEMSHTMCQLQDASTFIPTRVIDVGPKRIFRDLTTPVLRDGYTLPPGSQYLTLSHCWGGTVPMRLMTSNVSSMMAIIPFNRLPKTFQDAMVVTQHLGLRYIWIDSLCIIQDDKQDWQRESALMAEVYRNATCNLTAAEAPDSSKGLFLDHDPIFTKPLKARFTTDDQGQVLHDFWPEYLWSWGLDDGPLMKRGWVLQERLLSRRNLHFKQDQVAWECRGGTSCETFPGQLPFKEVPRPLKHRFSQALYGGHRDAKILADAWDLTVSRYTACKLSYSTDKLIAFGGIASTFSEFFGRRYLAGLWLENIAYQLCWSGKASKSAEYAAPSWSWASTEGSVSNAFLPMHADAIVQQLEVLDAQVDLVSQNPYGQVKSGVLRVAGRLTTAKIAYQDGVMGERRATLLLPDANGAYMPIPQNLSLSWSESDILDAQQQPWAGGVVYILAVLDHVNATQAHRQAMAGHWEMDVRRAPSTRWLVLCLVENQPATFLRYGTFPASDSDYPRFEEACRWFDQRPGQMPVHSVEGGTTRYAVSLI
ncbi:hypothetical protein AK830_g3361 [Neonectria ditissima]|uniref:Uncharacterized protein n=1 Tax=Neonectria ditissima TaxID=78410 RepID=A0A0P7B904_9HYPO|nr:hypothetical protein AK830_g3361 [Neonectria ditissima]